LAKKTTRTRAAADIDPSHELPGHVAGSTEQVLMDFAEDLGTLLGTAEKKAHAWLDQRATITEQLTQLRNKADELLHKLGGSGGHLPGPFGKRRGRPPGSANRAVEDETGQRPGRPRASVGSTVAEAARKGRTFTAAQRRAAADRMRKYWAERRKQG
jgi:hypothetical protein